MRIFHSGWGHIEKMVCLYKDYLILYSSVNIFPRNVWKHQKICRYAFTSVPWILLFHGCWWVKGSFCHSFCHIFSITWPMNDSGATVFVANSHSFFIAALSWKTSCVPDHPPRAWLHFHHWWMKCNADTLLFTSPDVRTANPPVLFNDIYIAHTLEIVTSLANMIF